VVGRSWPSVVLGELVGECLGKGAEVDVLDEDFVDFFPLYLRLLSSVLIWPLMRNRLGGRPGFFFPELPLRL